MGWEAFFCVAVLAAVFSGMVLNKPPDALLIGALVAVTLVGIVTPAEAFSGFSNNGMLTVAALYVVAAALRETGALDKVGAWVLGRTKSERRVLLKLSASVTVMSAFLNNTPIVAMFIPILTKWCRNNNASPSRLLLPLSYLTILGGTCTLIGTSTNLVVSGLMDEASSAHPGKWGHGLDSIGMFELSRVGVPYAIVGILYLIFIAPRLLPQRKTFSNTMAESAREYLVNIRVEQNCPLVGQSIEKAGLRHLPGLYLIEITRGEEVIAPVSPDRTLMAGDALTFTGVVDTIVDLEKIPGLVPIADEGYVSESAKQRSHILCEAVVSGTSPCIGKTIRDADFRATYGAGIIAVHRGGERVRGKVGDIALRPGDTLLLQGSSHFVRANRNTPDFLLIAGVEDSRPVRHEKVFYALGLLALLVVMLSTKRITDVVSPAMVALAIAGMMVGLRCISVADARRNVDWQTLITIAAAFGVGKALENSGCAEAIGGWIVNITGPWGPCAVLAGVYLVTSLFTELVTNNAAAALMFPFTIAIADQLGLNPRPFVMAVAFAASASFMTPLGYQTNLMVFGPGQYRFQDFFKVGLPLNLLLLALATMLIPMAWPFAG